MIMNRAGKRLFPVIGRLANKKTKLISLRDINLTLKEKPFGPVTALRQNSIQTTEVLSPKAAR